MLDLVLGCTFYLGGTIYGLGLVAAVGKVVECCTTKIPWEGSLALRGFVCIMCPLNSLSCGGEHSMLLQCVGNKSAS
jgi:hypothetical protein